MNYKSIILLILSLFYTGCCSNNDVKQEDQVFTLEKVAVVDTLLFNPDTAGYLLQLPMGNPGILKKWNNDDQIAELYDSYQINQNFCDSFLCGKKISYNPFFLKEAYNEDIPMYIYNIPPDAVISKKMLLKNGYKFYFVSVGSSRPLVKIFLISMKNNQLIDSKTIYYHQEGESGYTRGQLFYMDPDMIFSLRAYSFTEEGIVQSDLSQFIVNANGRFVQYYPKNGLYQTKEVQGMISNHLREGKWIEKERNTFLYIKMNYNANYNITYLESTYNAGIPIGEWYFFRFEIEPGQDISFGKKGELVYTEIYEDGKLKERIFEKEM